MNNNNTFRLGQIVQLKTTGTLSRGYGAQRGARAKVARIEYKDAYCRKPLIDVEWIRNNKSGLQGNGGYNVCDFELVGNKQMLFSFMYE